MVIVMTENKRFTRAEINKIIHDMYLCIVDNTCKLYGDEMSLGERLLFTDIHNTIENMVDYTLEKLENGDLE